MPEFLLVASYYQVMIQNLGPEQDSVKVGQYVLIAHGRWTRGIKIEDEEGEKTIRKIDPNDVLMVSDEPVQDDTLSDKVI
jgi:hydrogenase maturation factor